MKQPLLPLICAVGACGLALSACGSQVAETNGGGTAQSASSSTVARTAESRNKEASTFKNEVLTTPDLKIRITRAKVIGAGQKGNEHGNQPIIAFWYKTTNRSGAQVDPMAFLFHFRAYQDNNPNAENQLNVGSLPDDRFLGSQTENIKKGGTVENAVAYTLDDTATPVDLVAVERLDRVIGKVTYQLPK